MSAIFNDLIIAAYNNAQENLKKKSSEELSKATGGMNLPFDLKFPFYPLKPENCAFLVTDTT